MHARERGGWGWGKKRVIGNDGRCSFIYLFFYFEGEMIKRFGIEPSPQGENSGSQLAQLLKLLDGRGRLIMRSKGFVSVIQLISWLMFKL